MREGRRQGVRLGLASGRCALGAASAERGSHGAVASSSLGDSPGCWPSAGPGVGGRRSRLGRRAWLSAGAGWGWVAPRAGRAEGCRAVLGSGFPFAQLGKRACPWTGRRESGRPHLFLSHCSLAGKEMTVGVSHPGALTPALRWGCLQAPCLCHASRLGSVLAPRPTPSPPTVHCAPSLSSSVRLNTEGLSNAYMVDKLGGKDKE